jgi:hypothetical protein
MRAQSIELGDLAESARDCGGGQVDLRVEAARRREVEALADTSETLGDGAGAHVEVLHRSASSRRSMS